MGDRTLAEYDPARYNILMPSAELLRDLGPMLKVRVTEVHVSSDPADQQVYPVRGKKDTFTLAKPAIEALMRAAGISDKLERADDRKNPLICEMSALGAIRMTDGTHRLKSRSCLRDLSVVEQQVRADCIDDLKEKRKSDDPKLAWVKRLSSDEFDDVVDRNVERRMLQERRFLVQKTETGAALRLGRSMLELDWKYTREQLNRPFVVPRVSFEPDWKDPDVKAAMLEKMASGAAVLYGFRSETAALPPPAEAAVTEEVPEASETNGHSSHFADPRDIAGGPVLSDEDREAARTAELLGMEPGALRVELSRLVERTGYKAADGAKPIEKLEKSELVTAILKLDKLPDKQR